MKILLQQDMEAGAFGLSTGLEYDPGIYSSNDEILQLAKVVTPFGGRYISHIRSEDRYFWKAIDEVITIGRQDIEIAALTRMQELAKLYKLGVRVDQVQLKNVNPPREVQASFNEVNKAQQDRENAINIANGDYNEAVPKARGQADQTIRGAEGYRFKRVNEAEGDVASFNAMLEQYIKAPEITRTRLYLETMGDVLPDMGPKMIIDDSMKQLLPILPLSIKPPEVR